MFVLKFAPNLYGIYIYDDIYLQISLKSYTYKRIIDNMKEYISTVRAI